MNYTCSEIQKSEDEFITLMQQTIKKYGVPERMYIDTGKATIVMIDNKIKTFPTPCMARSKKIERLFKDITDKF